MRLIRGYCFSYGEFILEGRFYKGWAIGVSRRGKPTVWNTKHLDI